LDSVQYYVLVANDSAGNGMTVSTLGKDEKNPLSDGDWVGFWVLLIKNPLKPIYGWVLTDLFTVFIEIFQSTLLSCN